MLKTIKQNDYVVLKLVTGDEILGKLIEETDTHLNLNKPRILHIQQGANGQAEAMLIPYIQLSEDTELQFGKSTVVTVGKMSEQIKKDYIRVVSGLLV